MTSEGIGNLLIISFFDFTNANYGKYAQKIEHSAPRRLLTQHLLLQPNVVNIIASHSCKTLFECLLLLR